LLYIDTSLLVSSLTREPDSPRIQVWLERETADGGLISWLVETEFSAALSVKLRRGDINQAERAAARQGFVDLIAMALASVPVERHHYQLAANFADRHSLGLRAADALHLAIAYDNGATLCTLDRRLSEAGPEVGVDTVLV
jgi:uncharacterized protein